MIGLVVDSTADLPVEFYEKNNVKMVPLTTRFGETVYRDWYDLKPLEFYKLLREGNVISKTSQPTPQQFVEAYNELAKQGAEAIISLHISSKLSGTVNSAEVARNQVDIPVHIIDSKFIGGGIAFILLKLIEMRDKNSSLEEMLTTAREMISKIHCLGYLETLKYLEVGGRIGKAQSFLGTMLDLKPILTIEDGIVAPYRRERGTKKALKSMVQGFQELSSGLSNIFVSLAHADAPDRLQEVKTMLQEVVPRTKFVLEQEIGSVLGTYVGPGAIFLIWYGD